MDKLKAMRSFVEVADCASFTQAAQRLSLSKLQVSRHVQQLESWLSQRLFHRTTRNVSLTFAGEQALQRFERILQETTALELHAEQVSEQLSGLIRVTAPVGLAHHLLSELIDAFLELHPLVQIDVVASDHNSPLVDQRIDVAFRYTDQPDEHLYARRLMNISAVVCASETYLREYGTPAHPQALSEHNCLVHLQHNQWQFFKQDSSYCIDVTGNLRANDLGVIIRSALKGRGIIHIPCDMANPYIAKQQLIPVLADYSLPTSALWAVYLSRNYQHALVRAFIDFAVKQWRDDILPYEYR